MKSAITCPIGRPSSASTMPFVIGSTMPRLSERSRRIGAVVSPSTVFSFRTASCGVAPRAIKAPARRLRQ
jgi:hypothetical protein